MFYVFISVVATLLTYVYPHKVYGEDLDEGSQRHETLLALNMRREIVQHPIAPPDDLCGRFECWGDTVSPRF